ncbi:hypothetical protein FHY12_000203 [Xanthomonas arboricola]|uniref:hypothetical protein n=1 Tax=Xanthomonas euroxanthea TaxID=2259622 RepID=UPI0017F88CAE|nr:hypothetical protein [Xanthomonas euroxanthea]MBB3814758.1 hypothetical protein [Xanthomonas euroxanthea]NIK07720.1 hypothetical protein [Xanthomonas euroxanthea]NIK37918.1 hypothetical protein [Xanthomonas euroxanthea]
MREAHAIYEPADLEAWFMPKESELTEDLRPRFRNACAALTAVLTGQCAIARAAADHGLCRKRLRHMLLLASETAPDGRAFGYRVCVPWGTYQRRPLGQSTTKMPRQAGAHALTGLLGAQPTIRGWVDEFDHPLPPGRPPKVFQRLHKRITAELKRLDLHDCYPLNQPDKGRRALLRFLRNRRMIVSGGDWDTQGEAVSRLQDIFLQAPFTRTELDGHRIDIEAVLGVRLPNGGTSQRPITSLWLLVEVEAASRAVVGWALRVGRAYNNLDVAHCLAMSLRPWARRVLTIPGLDYAPGAGLPSGLLTHQRGWRSRLVAMDNAKAHLAIDLEQSVCRARGGMLVFGKAHQPRSRPIVEQLFSRLERGALREVPGGFEPATRLGEDKMRISNFSPGDHPIQLHLFEELLDVIIANYNATPHSALGDISPLQFLQMHRPRAFDFRVETENDGDDAVDMGSVLVPVIVKGNRDDGVMPHVNYAYTRYRSPDLDNKWELVGKRVLARVNRHDLRTLLLMRSVTTPLCVVRAAAPWNRTVHDETTRKMIMQWTKLRKDFSIVGAECAVQAYVDFLRATAPTSQQAVDQLARMQQLHDGSPPSRPVAALQQPLRMPPGGWICLDED